MRRHAANRHARCAALYELRAAVTHETIKLPADYRLPCYAALVSPQILCQVL